MVSCSLFLFQKILFKIYFNIYRIVTEALYILKLDNSLKVQQSKYIIKKRKKKEKIEKLI